MSTNQPTPSPNPATPRRAAPAGGPGGGGGDYITYTFGPSKVLVEVWPNVVRIPGESVDLAHEWFHKDGCAVYEQRRNGKLVKRVTRRV